MSFHDQVRAVVNDVLSDPISLPAEFTNFIPQHVAMNPVPVNPTAPIYAMGLATPVLRGEAGGTIIAGGGGAAAGSYLCNMDSTPVAAGTLANQVLSLFFYQAALDDPPQGYKTQWMLEVDWTTNAGSPAVTLTWSMWQITAVGGAAGGYTTTMAGSLASSLNVAKAFAGVSLSGATSGWSDTGATGGLSTGNVYAFAVNNNGTFAASSACRWRAKLWRRFVPS